LPVDKKPGDEVFAGTQNLTGALEIRVTRAGQDTTLGKVRDLILAAEKTKLPIMRIMDQYMGFYTPLVLVIGALVWAFTHDLSRVIAIFIVSCPCAFILATPSAMVAALSAAARLGYSSRMLGTSSWPRASMRLYLTRRALSPPASWRSAAWPRCPARRPPCCAPGRSAEKYSNHPAAKALAQLAGEAGFRCSNPGTFPKPPGGRQRAN